MYVSTYVHTYHILGAGKAFAYVHIYVIKYSIPDLVTASGGEDF